MVPNKLIVTVFSNNAHSTSSNFVFVGPTIPAVLTTASIWPCSEMTFATRA